MTSAEVDRCRVEWGMGGVSSRSRLEGLGKRRELLQRGPGHSPGRKRIMAYFEGNRMIHMTKSEEDNLH